MTIFHTFHPLRIWQTKAATVLLSSLLALPGLPSHALDLNNIMFNSDTAYSAVQTTKVNNDSFTVDVFREDQKLRMNINEQDQKISVIMRLDQETNYMLMHDMSLFQEVKSKRIKQYQYGMNMQFTNQQEVGTEEVNGHKCTKYTADFQNNDGHKGSGTYWVNGDDIMIRAVITEKRRRKTTETTMDVTNVQVGDQPDDLFEVPDNYQSLGLGSLMRQFQKN